MKIDLARQMRRNSKRSIVLANIKPTKAQAGDLAAIYLRVVNAWAASVSRIVAAYSAAVSKLQTDSASDAGSTIDSIAAEIDRLVLMLTPDLRDWVFRIERWQRGRFAQSVLSASDVDLTTILSASDVNETVEAALNWNTALVRDVASQTRQRIANAVFAGLQRRAPAAEIAKEISEATGMARSRSRRIASDQTSKLGARLNQARQEQAGIRHFRWRHSGKRHPRSWHVARDGKTYPWEGNGIPPDDMPSVPPWCGCSAQAVILPETDQ